MHIYPTNLSLSLEKVGQWSLLLLLFLIFSVRWPFRFWYVSDSHLKRASICWIFSRRPSPRYSPWATLPLWVRAHFSPGSAAPVTFLRQCHIICNLLGTPDKHFFTSVLKAPWVNCYTDIHHDWFYASILLPIHFLMFNFIICRVVTSYSTIIFYFVLWI